MRAIFACRKYRKLRMAAEDEVLVAMHSEFLASHEAVCEECLAYSQDLAAARHALREARLDAHVRSGFTSIVARRLRWELLQPELRAWRPAMLGAAMAAMALGAIIQILTTTPQISPATPVGTAEVQPNPDAPVFEPALPEVDSPTDA